MTIESYIGSRQTLEFLFSYVPEVLMYIPSSCSHPTFSDLLCESKGWVLWTILTGVPCPGIPIGFGHSNTQSRSEKAGQ